MKYFTKTVQKFIYKFVDKTTKVNCKPKSQNVRNTSFIILIEAKYTVQEYEVTLKLKKVFVIFMLVKEYYIHVN